MALRSLSTVIWGLELFENILFVHYPHAVKTSKPQRVLPFYQELRLNRFPSIRDARRIRASHYSSYGLRKFDSGLLGNLIISYDVYRRARRDQGNLVDLAGFELTVFYLYNILLAIRFRRHVHCDTDDVSLTATDSQDFQNIERVAG